jgi:DNA-binding transcriptional regulator YhcF (GntR family)
MAKVVRLTTRPERVKRETAAELRQLILAYPEQDLPAQPRAAILNVLSRATCPDNDHGIWPGGFTMISRKQTEVVWDAIRALPAKDRPNQVRHAFDLVLLNLRPDNGEVMLTRDEMAAKIGCASANLSRVMGTLERMGVVQRERRKVAGVQGPGMVVYFINPHVAWNGSLEIRKQEAAEVAQPSLHLVQT